MARAARNLNTDLHKIVRTSEKAVIVGIGHGHGWVPDRSEGQLIGEKGVGSGRTCDRGRIELKDRIGMGRPVGQRCSGECCGQMFEDSLDRRLHGVTPSLIRTPRRLDPRHDSLHVGQPILANRVPIINNAFKTMK
jgi:hypothetical protein